MGWEAARPPELMPSGTTEPDSVLENHYKVVLSTVVALSSRISRAGPGCLNRISAMIRASTGVRPPYGFYIENGANLGQSNSTPVPGTLGATAF